MNIRLKILLPALGVLLAAAMLAQPPGARAETITYCTQIAQADIPKTISTSGVYCVTEDLSYTSTNSAITITASNVVLDLNAHLLDGSSSTGADGIRINGSSSRNVTIKNGTIRAFLRGVYVSSASDHLIEDLTLDGNTFIAIYLHANYSTARNNRIINTGPTTGDLNTVAIFASNLYGARILDNDVVDTHASGDGWADGIFASGCDNCLILDNRVSDTSSGTGPVSSIRVNTSANTIIEGNSMRGTTSSDTTYGLRASWAPSILEVVNNRVSGADTGFDLFSTVRFRDNIASNVTTKYSGSADDLGNND